MEKCLKECKPQQDEKLFPDLENKEAADVGDILNGAVIGRQLCHMWYDADTNRQMYNGRIIKTKKKKNDVHVVSFYKTNEDEEEDAVEYDMNKHQLAADIICGDLVLS